MDKIEKILIYKRTHTGDPNEKGEFGISDCMGIIRNYDFDAVIGIGGIGSEPRDNDIDGKVTWVGIHPKREAEIIGNHRAGIVTFSQYVILDHTGPLMNEMAPLLSKRLYTDCARFVFSSLTPQEHAEALDVIKNCLVRKSLDKVEIDEFECNSCVCSSKNKFRTES